MFRSTVLAAFVVALSIATTKPSAAIDLPSIPHEFYTLDNGLEVILHEDHSTPIVGVNIWYHVGSKNERPGRSGFAHLFEHMMFQGSEHQDAEFFGPLQSVGGTLNGSTSEDRTNYWEIMPSNHLERALLMEADRMGWLLPAMTQEKLDNQKEVVRNERRESEGRPYSKFWLNFNENFYPKGHPYDHSVIGIHEDLEAATLDDVKDFFRKYYTPNNATLSIAGDFDSAQVKEWIQEYFGEIPPGKPVEEVAVWIPELAGEKRLVTEDKVQLTRVHYAWHSPQFYADGDADLDLAARVLGQGATSRLYKRLVHGEKLAQDVSLFQSSGQVASAFVAMITLRPDADEALAEAIFNEEIAKFAKSGPTKDELARAKNAFEADFIKGVQRIGSWGGKNDRLNRYNHYVGTPDYFQQDYERYTSRTSNTVRDAFAKWCGPDKGRMVYTIYPMGQLEATETPNVVRTELPEGGPQPAMPSPRIDRQTLSNGLELAVMEHTELPLVQVNLTFKTGSANAPKGLSGISDFAAEMLLEGTKRHDKFEFESELERLGTDLSVYTQDNYTVFEMTTLKKHLDTSLELLNEALTEASFPQAEFDLQKDRRLVDIRRQKDSPNLMAAKASRRIIYGDGHPYGELGSGTEQTVGAITHQAVQDYANQHFTPGNATMVVVGDVTADEFQSKAEEAFEDWTGNAPARFEIHSPERRNSREVYLVNKPGDTQSTLVIGHLGIERNDDSWEKVFVANRILGGFFSSRLNLNLREDKGYTYGVRSGTSPRVGISAFTMSGRVQTEVTDKAIVEFLKEIEGIQGNRPITQEELDFAKDNILLGYSREFETITQLADAVTEQIAYGLRDDDLARYPEKVAAVDLSTANAIAREYFRPSDLAIIVVGDLEKIEDSIRALNLGTVHYADENGNILRELSSR